MEQRLFEGPWLKTQRAQPLLKRLTQVEQLLALLAIPADPRQERACAAGEEREVWNEAKLEDSGPGRFWCAAVFQHRQQVVHLFIRMADLLHLAEVLQHLPDICAQWTSEPLH